MRVNLVGKVDFLLCVLVVQVPLEVRIGYFIPAFELPVVLGLLLNSVVRQVNHLVVKVFYCELFARRPYVPFLVPVAFKNSVYRGHQYVATNIEFPAVEEHRSIDVELDDVRFLFPVRVFFVSVYDFVDFAQLADDGNPVAPC